MLAIRRVLNSCIQTDLDVTEINDSNKENSAVRDPFRADRKSLDCFWIVGILYNWSMHHTHVVNSYEAKLKEIYLICWLV